ncbi:MAG: ABC transporter ATP-binding protein [Anaerolineae bacterium]|nr:ABC transporter ATP-binding protein [Anaerolineae bacterium]
MIELNNIRKSYQMGAYQVDALRGIDVSIEQGEFVAIVGASGSGKSTLMHIIGCLDIPTEGQYVLNGTDVSTLSDKELSRLRNKEIGFVFQQFNLLARTPAIEQVSLPMMYAGIAEKERTQRAQEALTHVGLGERFHHDPTELSGGQQQRVAIARALVTNPSLILADEPTGALDSSSGAGILQLFEELHDEGKTIVMVTHDAEVAAHAGRLVHLKDGLVIEDSQRELAVS